MDPAIQMIPVGKIGPSPTNPRKRFDPAKLRALGDTIKARGLDEPITVRPWPKKREQPSTGSEYDETCEYELIDGERRWRAAALVGVKKLPAIVRKRTDAEVAEQQLVSFDQKEDLSPSERAGGYRQLVTLAGSIDKAAEKIGKSATWVRGFLLLETCPEELLAAVDDGKVGRTTAELVCRLPQRHQQDLAARCVLSGATNPAQLGASPSGEWFGQFLSFRETKELISTHFQRELKGAPFKAADKKLVPSAGSCTDCPKRVGNAKLADPDAFEGTRDDICLDPACYRDKCKAQEQRDAAKAARSAAEPEPTANGKTPLKVLDRPDIKQWMAEANAASPVPGWSPDQPAAADPPAPTLAAPGHDAAVRELGRIAEEWCREYVGDPFADDPALTLFGTVFKAIAGNILLKWDRSDLAGLVALTFAEAAKSAAKNAGMVGTDAARLDLVCSLTEVDWPTLVAKHSAPPKPEAERPSRVNGKLKGEAAHGVARRPKLVGA